MEESFMGLLKEAAPDRLCCHRRWFAKLRSLYESPSRHYHRLSHVESMLSGIGSVFLVDEFQDVTATRLAVWFHDAIYDATAGDNEEQSAVLFQEYAQEMAMDEAQARQVAEMIIATKRHRTAAHESDTTAPTGTDDVHRMLDLDMMILGSEWDVYEAYSQAIRREYAHLTTDAFCAGRARALRSFLSIPHIFCTRTGHELWEERARANIAKEIGILERSSASE